MMMQKPKNLNVASGNKKTEEKKIEVQNELASDFDGSDTETNDKTVTPNLNTSPSEKSEENKNNEKNIETTTKPKAEPYAKKSLLDMDDIFDEEPEEISISKKVEECVVDPANYEQPKEEKGYGEENETIKNEEKTKKEDEKNEKEEGEKNDKNEKEEGEMVCEKQEESKEPKTDLKDSEETPTIDEYTEIKTENENEKEEEEAKDKNVSYIEETIVEIDEDQKDTQENTPKDEIPNKDEFNLFKPPVAIPVSHTKKENSTPTQKLPLIRPRIDIKNDETKKIKYLSDINLKAGRNIIEKEPEDFEKRTESVITISKPVFKDKLVEDQEEYIPTGSEKNLVNEITKTPINTPTFTNKKWVLQEPDPEEIEKERRKIEKEEEIKNTHQKIQQLERTESRENFNVISEDFFKKFLPSAFKFIPFSKGEKKNMVKDLGINYNTIFEIIKAIGTFYGKMNNYIIYDRKTQIDQSTSKQFFCMVNDIGIFEYSKNADDSFSKPFVIFSRQKAYTSWFLTKNYKTGKCSSEWSKTFGDHAIETEHKEIVPRFCNIQGGYPVYTKEKVFIGSISIVGEKNRTNDDNYTKFIINSSGYKYDITVVQKSETPNSGRYIDDSHIIIKVGEGYYQLFVKTNDSGLRIFCDCKFDSINEFYREKSIQPDGICPRCTESKKYFEVLN